VKRRLNFTSSTTNVQADVIRELGYPDRKTLAKWYKIYIETGVLYEQNSRYPKYSLEQREQQ